MQKGKKLNPLTILFPVAIAAFGVYYIIKKNKTPKTIKNQTTDFYAKNNNVKDTNVVKTNVKDTPKVESKTYLGELGDKLNNILSFLKP
jgi:hypothetical protein